LLSPSFRVKSTVRKPRQADEEEAEASTGASRGSWVEKARAIDPTLIKKEEREVPERKRTLKHSRYKKYIEQHGTNEVTVRAHTRSVPLLNVSRTTRARARRYDNSEPK
jgi:hypothetical protein